MPRSSDRYSNKADVTALMGAFCFFLSAIEYMLPKPMPFMRLGIANLPILLAVDILPFGWYILLAFVKVIGMSLISGTLFSYVAVFSLAGTMAAALAMWGTRRAGGRFISQIGVSIVGAMVSNAVQIVIARFLVFRETAWLIAPLFLGMGLITGAALGIFSEHFARISRWYALASGRAAESPEEPAELAGAAAAAGFAAAEDAAGSAAAAADKPKLSLPARLAEFFAERRRRKEARARKSREKGAEKRARRRQRAETLFSPGWLALAGIASMIAFLSMKWVPGKFLMLVLFAFAARATGKRFSLATTLVVSLGIILANLIIPVGKVLGTVLGLKITVGALVDGIGKALTFEGLMYISKASILPGLKLPGQVGRIVAAAFTYYDRIIEYKGRIRPAALAADADALMIRVWESAEPASEPAPAEAVSAPGNRAARRKGAVILAVCVVLVCLIAIFLG